VSENIELRFCAEISAQTVSVAATSVSAGRIQGAKIAPVHSEASSADNITRWPAESSKIGEVVAIFSSNQKVLMIRK